MKLEKYLVLNKYFLSIFGFSNFGDFKRELENKQERFDNDGRSYFVDVLIGLENLKIGQDELLKYDEAIKEYSDRLSENRRQNITLKYFQYIAVLFAEIFLDRYFNRRRELLTKLNLFLQELNQEEKLDISLFTESDLKKIAYWMATGSGKTLIMHINYWQFLKYNTEVLDNIILITPNEGLSKQHFDEMQKSGVPCKMYSENPDSLTLYRGEVFIIDIHKLTEEKRGTGVRVETSYFEGKNLVFIDEGHKGQATEEKVWKKLREDLGKDGFIFEYSATFGQVISEKDKDLIEEYSKAILFDYSYKYFYTDGYGKDFYVYNIREDSFTKKYEEIILTGNLLSFYEQNILYKNHRDELKEYLIEKPLWAFVGSKVSGAGLNSDVLKVVKFLKKAIENTSFFENNIAKVIGGKSGLLDLEGKDIFRDRFKYIKQGGCNISDIYQKLFNGSSGSLYFYELKSAEGEIGLRIGEGEYFGVINIGDVSAFKKLLEKSGIETKTDTFTPSLFEKINENNSNINILIGAKKFIEGWDSWRVCSMGLINMGKGEGPQIIQLFGRGVRLKGRNFSLKRSEENKHQIKSLETLNIFGLNADYINTFLETIRKEEVEYEEIKLPIKFEDERKWKRLYTLRTRRDFDFSNHFMELETNQDILEKVKIDIRPKVKLAHGLETSITESEEGNIHLEEDYLNLLSWDEIYLKILNYKITKGYFNLTIPKTILTNIVRNQIYELYAFNEQVTPKNFSDLAKLEEIILIVLRTYIDKFYNFKSRRAEAKQMQLSFMVKEDENLSYKDYTLKIPKDRKKDIKKIRNLLKEVERLYREDIEEIPTIHFDKHLYTPLVVYGKGKDVIKTEPPRLNEGETKFLRRLRDYLKNNKSKFKGEEIFLLRNLSRKGIKFFQTSGFYPDFIMWVRSKDEQTTVFIDPKGIRNLGNFNDEKIQLHKNIKEIEKEIKKEIKIDKIHKKLRLESLILSVSKYKDIKKNFEDRRRPKEDFEKNHILFMEDKNLMDKLFKKLLIPKTVETKT